MRSLPKHKQSAADSEPRGDSAPVNCSFQARALTCFCLGTTVLCLVVRIKKNDTWISWDAGQSASIDPHTHMAYREHSTSSPYLYGWM